VEVEREPLPVREEPRPDVQEQVLADASGQQQERRPQPGTRDRGGRVPADGPGEGVRPPVERGRHARVDGVRHHQRAGEHHRVLGDE
jgi:hypothetical protein